MAFAQNNLTFKACKNIVDYYPYYDVAIEKGTKDRYGKSLLYPCKIG